MTKKASTSPVGMEMKKEYLKKHLDEVGELIVRWKAELNAPRVFALKGSAGGWQSVYRPPTEENPDNNHILRRHLRSRALWSHHAHWERGLDRVWDLIQQVRSQAVLLHTNKPNGGRRQYQDDYIETAVWEALNKAFGRGEGLEYRPGDDHRPGVIYGAYRIEKLTTDREEQAQVQHEHRQLVVDIAQLGAIEELAEECVNVLRWQDYMQSIAGKILKSRDILYPCKFCKHLWK